MKSHREREDETEDTGTNYCIDAGRSKENGYGQHPSYKRTDDKAMLKNIQHFEHLRYVQVEIQALPVAPRGNYAGL